MPHLFDLTGKVAIVTGSSRGIGQSIAESMAELGAKVVVSSRKADACENVAKGIRAKGGNAHVIACNISRKPEVEALIEGTQKHFGGIDVLVCNAAVNPYYGPLANMPDDAFDKIMASNVKSNIWLANLAVPSMEKRGGGINHHRVHRSAAFAAPAFSAPMAFQKPRISRWLATLRSSTALETFAPIASRRAS